MTKTRILTALAAFLLALTLSQATSARWNGGGGGGGENDLSDEEIDDILFMREEEKLARDSYLLLGNEWGLTIFDNIAESEQRHMDAMKKLIDNYDLVDPVSGEEEIGSFVDPVLVKLFDDLMTWGFQSPLDGLYVGGAIEETDIVDIQLAIERAEHTSIIETYESLLCGSRNHLRSFVRQIELNGEPYEPFKLTQQQLDAIVNTPMERDCESNDRKGKGPR